MFGTACCADIKPVLAPYHGSGFLAGTWLPEWEIKEALRSTSSDLRCFAGEPTFDAPILSSFPNAHP